MHAVPSDVQHDDCFVHIVSVGLKPPLFLCHSFSNPLHRLGLEVVACDVNRDGRCDATDIDDISKQVQDEQTTFETRRSLIEGPEPHGFNTYIGDANLDGQFDEQDLVAVFISGKYLTGEAVGWANGDWDGDGVFDERDFIAAFIAGGYLAGPRSVV